MTRGETSDAARCRWPECNCYAPGAPQNCIRDEARKQYRAFVERINRTPDREIDATLKALEGREP